MIYCPWCGNHIQLINYICPECKHEVLPEHLSSIDAETTITKTMLQ